MHIESNAKIVEFFKPAAACCWRVSEGRSFHGCLQWTSSRQCSLTLVSSCGVRWVCRCCLPREQPVASSLFRPLVDGMCRLSDSKHSFTYFTVLCCIVFVFCSRESYSGYSLEAGCTIRRLTARLFNQGLLLNRHLSSGSFATVWWQVIFVHVSVHGDAQISVEHTH